MAAGLTAQQRRNSKGLQVGTVHTASPFTVIPDGNSVAINVICSYDNPAVNDRVALQRIRGRRYVALPLFEPTAYVPPVVLQTPRYYVGGAGGPAFQGAWTAYPNFEYPPLSFYIDAKGRCRLNGLTTGGTGTIFTLPVGFRPAFTLSFACSATGGARVDILPNGNVNVIDYYLSGSNGYVSLTGIEFFPETLINATTGQTTWPWTIIAPTSPWTNYSVSGGYPPLRYYIDVDGFIYWSGAIKGGTVASSQICAMPVGTYPTDFAHLYHVIANAAGGRLSIGITGTMVLTTVTTGGTSAYVSLDQVAYHTGINGAGANGTDSGWRNISLLNSWVPYATGYDTTNKTRRDSAGIIWNKGMIKSGTPNTPVTDPVAGSWRPGEHLIWIAAATDSICRADIFVEGTGATLSSYSVASYATGGSNTWVNTSQLRWQAPLPSVW